MAISKKILLFFFLLTFSACSSPNVETPVANLTPVPTASTPTRVLATETVAPPPTEIPPTPTPAPALLTPNWMGWITRADKNTEAILVDLEAGSLIIQPQAEALTLENITREGTTLAFHVTGERAMAFVGQWDGLYLMGQVEENGASAPFGLMPMAEAGNLEDFAGTYQFEEGDALTVHLSPSYRSGGLDFFWTGLTITNFRNGAIRGLYPIGEDRFLVGSGRVIGYPFVTQITFTRKGEQVTGLEWQAYDSLTGQAAEGLPATRLNLPTETVTYTSSDGVTLTGLLTLPITPGPHPAIVISHGSERGERNDFFREEMRTFLASQGIVALTYDKRGVGDSGGTYREAATEENLALLAQDVLASVAYLKARPEVDGSKIGLIGSSQAGWVFPLAASQAEDVAYFVLLSGPVVSTGTERAYSELTNNGDSPSHYTAEEISQQLAERTPYGFDPLPILATLKQPGLWIFGDVDQSIPVPESVNNLDKLIAGGQENFSYAVFASLDHTLQVSEQGLFREIPYSRGFGEGVFERILAWVMGVVQSP